MPRAAGACPQGGYISIWRGGGPRLCAVCYTSAGVSWRILSGRLKLKVREGLSGKVAPLGTGWEGDGCLFGVFLAHSDTEAVQVCLSEPADSLLHLACSVLVLPRSFFSQLLPALAAPFPQLSTCLLLAVWGRGRFFSNGDATWPDLSLWAAIFSTPPSDARWKGKGEGAETEKDRSHHMTVSLSLSKAAVEIWRQKFGGRGMRRREKESIVSSGKRFSLLAPPLFRSWNGWRQSLVLDRILSVFFKAVHNSTSLAPDVPYWRFGTVK